MAARTGGLSADPHAAHFHDARRTRTTWSVLAASVTNLNASGSFVWTVTGPATTTARIRVTWTANSAVQDLINVDFRIP